MKYKIRFQALSILAIFCFFLFTPSVTFAESYELAEKYGAEAETLSQQGKSLEAGVMFEKSAAAIMAAPEPMLQAAAGLFLRSAEHFVQAGRDEQAVASYEQCLLVARKIGDEGGILMVLFDLARLLQRMEKYERAVVTYRQGIEIAEKQGKDTLTALMLNNTGLAYFSLDQYEEAVDYYRQALTIYRKLNRKNDIAVLLNNIGLIFYSRGEYDKSLEYYKQVMEIERSNGNKKRQAKNLFNLGLVYRAMGELDQALEYNKQGVAISECSGDEADIATALNNIGGIYFEKGQYDKTIDYLKHSLKIEKKLGREAGIVSILNNIGQVYDSWGHYDKAIDYFQQALQINQKLDIEGKAAIILGNIGAIYGQKGQFEKSLGYYQQALKISRQIGSLTMVAIGLNNIGNVYEHREQYDKALEHYSQALDIGRQIGNEIDVAKYLNNIGGLYARKGQLDKALVCFLQAEESNRKTGYKAGLAAVSSNIGFVFYTQRKLEKSIKYLQNAISLFEEIRQTAKGDVRRDYLAKVIESYQVLAMAYIQKGYPQGVLDAVEKSRARLLAEQIAGIDKEQDLPLLEEIQQGLAGDEAILIFSNIDQKTFILMVITGKEVAMNEIAKDSFLAASQKEYQQPVLMLMEKQRGKVIQLETEREDKFFFDQKEQKKEFETAIHYYRKLLTDPTRRKESTEFGKRLHELLFEPAENQLVGKKKITIMPDGILGFLPFETLVDQENNYLAGKYTFRYTQSLTIDRLLRQRETTQRKKIIESPCWQWVELSMIQ